MLGTDLSYVKDQLARLGHAGWQAVAKATGVNIRTIKRIGYNEIQYPSSETVGKLAIHFRTREMRGRKST